MTSVNTATGMPQAKLLPANAYAPLNRNKGSFNTFERAKFTEAEEVKSATDFFVKEIAENKPVKSYLSGYKRYKDQVLNNPVELIKTTGIVLGLTLFQTMFRKQRARVESIFLLGFLAYPVSAAVNALPKMIDAYKLARSGEPTEGKTQFRQAFNEFIYQVFHNYVKPFTISAFMLFPVLNPTYMIRKAGTLYKDRVGWRKVANWGIKKLFKNPEKVKTDIKKPLQQFERWTDNFADKKWIKKWDKPALKIQKWGDKVLNWIK